MRVGDSLGEGTTMTTPERLRRRQRIEGTLLVILGVIMLIQFNYFQGQDEKQRECLFQVVQSQNQVLSLRGELARQDSEINADESAATRGLIVAVFAAKGKDDALAAFADAQQQWNAIDERRQDVRKARRENPIPDLPEGTCDA